MNSGQAFKKQLIPAEGDYSAVSKVSVWSALLRTGSHETNGSRVEGKSDVMWWRNRQVDTAGEGAPILVSHSYVLQTTHKSFINNCFFLLGRPATPLLPCFWLKGKNQTCNLLQNKLKNREKYKIGNQNGNGAVGTRRRAPPLLRQQQLSCLSGSAQVFRKESKLHVNMPNTTAIYERPPLPRRHRSCTRLKSEFLNVPLGVWLQRRLGPLAELSDPLKWDGVIRGSDLVSKCWPPVATRLTRRSRQRSCCDKWWWGGSYVSSTGHGCTPSKILSSFACFPWLSNTVTMAWFRLEVLNWSAKSELFFSKVLCYVAWLVYERLRERNVCFACDSALKVCANARGCENRCPLWCQKGHAYASTVSDNTSCSLLA